MSLYCWMSEGDLLRKIVSSWLFGSTILMSNTSFIGKHQQCPGKMGGKGTETDHE